MSNKLRHSFVIIIAIATTICMKINLEIPKSIGDCFFNFEVTDIFYAVLYYILFEKVSKIEDKRAKICCAILAVIFASCEIVGYTINKYWDLSCILGSKLSFIKAVFKLIAYSFLFYSMLMLLFTKTLPKIKWLKNFESKFFTCNAKSFFVIAIAIFLLYMPYFLAEYPGIISTDSVSEMSTALFSMNEMVNHHPVLHIAIISIFMNIGKLLNNYNIGIAIYSLMQMIASACVFSYMLFYLSKRNVNFWIRVICFAFVALYPPFACYSITMWKDVPFGLSMILYTICMIEIAINDDFMKSYKNVLFLTLTMVLVILFRNNGIYVVTLSIPAMVFFSKKYRAKMLSVSILVIIFYFTLKGPIFNLLNIKDGPIREALSVPLQQIARTVKYQESKLTNEEKDQINKYMPVEQIGELYYPLISDNVKDTLNNEEVKNNKIDFLLLWIKLLVKYPKEYVESFLSGSYGYWYPEAKNWIIWEFEDESYNIGRNTLNLNIDKNPKINNEIIRKIIHSINYDSLPIISGFFSIGFIFFTSVSMCVYAIYRKKHKMILAYLPIMFLWVTTIASPVWCEYRYVYSFFTCASLLIVSMPSLINYQKNMEQ